MDRPGASTVDPDDPRLILLRLPDGLPARAAVAFAARCADGWSREHRGLPTAHRDPPAGDRGCRVARPGKVIEAEIIDAAAEDRAASFEGLAAPAAAAAAHAARAARIVMGRGRDFFDADHLYGSRIAHAAPLDAARPDHAAAFHAAGVDIEGLRLLDPGPSDGLADGRPLPDRPARPVVARGHAEMVPRQTRSWRS